MRARALHPDVLVITSAVLQVNCVIVRAGASVDERASTPRAQGGKAGGVLEVIEPGAPGSSGAARAEGETFVIDSPVLPEELDALEGLLEQARFAPASGLLATHADWDHLLGRLAFPALALGCAQSSAERLQQAPGEPQRELRAFDEDLTIERSRPLALGSVQSLPVPGRCELGAHELELHPTRGHTADGMAILIGWAGVLVAGDYLSPVEIPMINQGGDLDGYISTLQELRALIARAEQVVPGHGAVLAQAQALEILEQDAAYLAALGERGREAELPGSRRGASQRRVHEQNLAAL